MTADELPIAVGVGQYSQRSEDLAQAPDPVSMMAIVARTAAEDAASAALLRQLDTVVVVNLLSWQYPDPAGQLAEKIGASPQRRIYTSLGGNTPQMQVNGLADRIAAGEIGIALLAGAEAMSSLRRAQKTGVKLPWPERSGTPELTGDTRWGAAPVEMSHRAQMPTQIYPLFENAIRAARGRSVAGQREFLGRFCERFAAVARDNPYAWFRDGKSAAEIATPGPGNRMIGFPYPKYMNAIMEVDQAAAVILTSVGMARKLGIPSDKWVYLWGGGDATDQWFVGERVNFHSSPAIRAAGREALAQASATIDEIRHFDFYSCFPCAVQIGAAMLGLEESDPRSLTMTGGLPYAGGPGNNYSTHGIAQMVERLRKDRDGLGIVTGVGWYMTKHSVGVYGGAPPRQPRRRRNPAEYQRDIDAESHPSVNEQPNGKATIETYTVLHDRDGAPETGIVIGRLQDGSRFWANTPADAALLAAMESEEFIGRPGKVRHDATTTLNVFEVAGA